MNKLLSLPLFAIVSVFAFSSATAEVVKMPVGSQAQTLKEKGRYTITAPKRGMSSKQVASLFGAPTSEHGPVGTPAISYWEYPDYTVYYESNTVLHTVLKRY